MDTIDPSTSRARPVSALRSIVWTGHMALPLVAWAALWLAPDIDATWKHNPSHFWLVAAVAFANVLIGNRVASEARDRADARLFLVGVGFVASAAFFTAHALITPQVIADQSNAGFQLAMPAGLIVFAAFGAWSAANWTPETSARLLTRQALLRTGVLGLAVVWAFMSVNGVPPLDEPLESGAFNAFVAPMTIASLGLLGFMALRYWQLHRRRPSAVSLALVTAATLLAETMLIVNVSRTWQLSWWLWHVVVLAAYGYVAYAAYVTLRLDGNAGGLFTSVGMDATVEQIRVELRRHVEQLLDAVAETEGDPEAAANALGDRLGLTSGQTQILAGAAEAIATERRHGQVHAALAELARYGVGDATAPELAHRTEMLLSEIFGTDVRCGLAEDGRLVHAAAPPGWPEITLEQLEPSGATVFPSARGDIVAYPVARNDTLLGDLEVATTPSLQADDDARLMRVFADRLALSYENVALYRELRRLFASYVPSEVAERLVADPRRAALGGAVVETTVLFADLRGFTSFSEETGDPSAIVELLNSYYAVAVPIITGEGGTVDKFVGDALMALFNTPVLQPDHALRAVRAAHRIQREIRKLAGDGPDRPRFRIGVNTGPALVGNIGSEEIRNFTAIGDAVNVAARLETAAEPGQVLIGAATQALVYHAVRSQAIGSLSIKGRTEPVEAFILEEVIGV